MDLIEELARALATEAGEDPDAKFSDGQIYWTVYKSAAEAILSRLDQLGLVVVPREPSEAMERAALDADLDIYWSYAADGRLGSPKAAYAAMINAALSDPRIEDAGLPKIPVLRIEGLDE